jgi:phosphatidylglycerophosphate synthase
LPHAAYPPRAQAVLREDEARRARDYPFSRWYLRPLSGQLAAALANTQVRPWHVTLCGLLLAASAAGVLLVRPAWAPCSALLVLAWWFCDRTDGQLARRQGSATPWGAWLDANIDELVDLGLHIALAAAAAAQGATWAWPLLVAFLFGKYLLMYGLQSPCSRQANFNTETQRHGGCATRLRTLYHFPGNADVRAHLLVLALLTGCFTAELALIAAYYNLRWMARYALVVGRDRRAA